MAKTLKIKNGDMVVSPMNGRPTLISGSDKLIQDVVEFFTVEIMSNGFGAGIEQLIGVLSFDGGDMMVALIDRQVVDGVAEFRALQKSNVTIPRTPDERILGVRDVHVKQDTSDPTKYYFTANILTESGRVIKLPQIGFGV